MSISLDKLLGNLPRNLQVYSQRSELLASNLANSDTPGFKAKDIDFRTVLASAGDELEMKATRSGHLGGPSSNAIKTETLYRVPVQPSLDGNTVDSQIERGEFTQNAIRYQSTLTFLNGRIQGLKLAIRGE
ncbi:MAG: flagellar basal body rod protein FlgB [Gammaproteobacteria bacterium]